MTLDELKTCLHSCCGIIVNKLYEVSLETELKLTFNSSSWHTLTNDDVEFNMKHLPVSEKVKIINNLIEREIHFTAILRHKYGYDYIAVSFYNKNQYAVETGFQSMTAYEKKTTGIATGVKCSIVK